jgi:hypothetical protein
MKKILLRLAIFSVTVLFASLATAAGNGSFKASLSGNEAVPRVKTKAKGDAVFHLSKDGKELTYKLTVNDIEDITAAHIHMGKKGKNGPPVAFLFAGPEKKGMENGVLSEGTLTDKDLIGPLKGKSIHSLVNTIKAGGAYVMVHTEKHPEGELRGQIR